MNKEASTAEVLPHPSAVMDKRVSITVFSTAIWSLAQGDPEQDNSPRLDPSTRHGYITPPGFKRKIRDYLALMGHPLFINRDNVALETHIKQSIETTGMKFDGPIGDDEADESSDGDEASKEDEDASKAKGKGQSKGTKALTMEEKGKVIRDLCYKFIDNRFFGATLCKPLNQPLTGPVQVSFSVTVDPIDVIVEPNTTRVCVTKESDLHKERTMGRLAVTPFALYRTEIDVCPAKAAKSGFTWSDYSLLLEAIQNMYEHSKSTGRSQMEVERIFVFMHDSALGNATSRNLRRRIKVTRKNPTGATELPPARSADDYEFTVDTDGLSGVTLTDIKL